MKKLIFVLLIAIQAVSCTKEIIVEVANPVNQQNIAKIHELQLQIGTLNEEIGVLELHVDNLSTDYSNLESDYEEIHILYELYYDEFFKLNDQFNELSSLYSNLQNYNDDVVNQNNRLREEIEEVTDLLGVTESNLNYVIEKADKFLIELINSGGLKESGILNSENFYLQGSSFIFNGRRRWNILLDNNNGFVVYVDRFDGYRVSVSEFNNPYSADVIFDDYRLLSSNLHVAFQYVLNQ